MAPAFRQNIRSITPKPYTRKHAIVSSVVPEQSSPHVTSFDPSTNISSKPGFPTYEQYKAIETTYLESLPPRNREKALITQPMLGRIWDILMNPNSRNESPQFRFWVRKMFTLGELHEDPLAGSGMPAQMAGFVVLHDDRPVATTERLYEMICFCHAQAEHGGRDKTRAVVRELYSWVPKTLVSQFVKVCPTCTVKKSGNLLLVETRENAPPQPKLSEKSASYLQTELVLSPIDNLVVKQRQAALISPSRGPLDVTNETTLRPRTHAIQPTPVLGSIGHHPDPRSVTHEQSSQSSSVLQLPSRALSQGPYGYPMSREVSLYKGLPNGWQYHVDYSQAYQAYMDEKDRIPDPSTIEDHRRAKRPRIPSIVPLRCANFAFSNQNAQDGSHFESTTLPPLVKTPLEKSSYDDVEAVPTHLETECSLPPSLQRLRIFSCHTLDTPTRSQAIPIDPVLLEEENRMAIRLEQFQGRISDRESHVFCSLSSSGRLGDSGNINRQGEQELAAKRLTDDLPIANEVRTYAKEVAFPLHLGTVTTLPPLEDFWQCLDWGSSDRSSTGNSSPFSPGKLSPSSMSKCESPCGSRLSASATSSPGGYSSFASAVSSPVQEYDKTAAALVASASDF